MKRLLDILLVLLALLFLWPVMLITAILVLIYHGKPVLFFQVRPGLNSVPFKMFKFRSMTNESDEQGVLLSNEKRLTKFGKFLRHSSLDELPELINVLKGDMSLVGPRPLLMDYLPLYNEYQNRRHEVKPGITGWAQVNGRNNISWNEKFELDVWYVDNRTLLLDVKILFLTVYKVFKKEGITHEGDVAMPRFKGDS